MNGNMLEAISLTKNAQELMEELLNGFDEVAEFDPTLTLNGDRLSDVADDNEYWEEWGDQQFYYRRLISALSLLIDTNERLRSIRDKNDLICSAIDRSAPEVYKNIVKEIRDSYDKLNQD
jgi:hypothetical protein